MWKKIWKHKLEFYPYFPIIFFWFFGAFLSSLAVHNRPGIFFPLGLVTIPSMYIIIGATIRTYKELPPDKE